MEAKRDDFPPKVSVLLMKDNKSICHTRQPFLSHDVSPSWNILSFSPHWPAKLRHFKITPEPESDHEKNEWKIFLDFLHRRKLAAIVNEKFHDFYVLPPSKKENYDYAKVFYKERQIESSSRTDHLEKDENFAHQYLSRFTQIHERWIFGAIAEFFDNSRDAKAKRVDISFECLYSMNEEKKIPVLSIIDDGSGMSHADIVQMFKFRYTIHQADAQRIGRFGMGFKNGAMRLGKDSLVLTQTSESRSIAFLSQVFNKNKEIPEVPIVTYCKYGQLMKVDVSIQSEASANLHLKAIKNLSPFNEYFIGEKMGKFGENGTGTQIYIWNLEKQDSEYNLEWESAEIQGDILIRDRIVRHRPGQTTKAKVPLDYSLKAYMEVIYLEPHMEIYIQGSRVKIRPWDKFLNNTSVVSHIIVGRHITLTLGYSQVEWERANSGFFLYWHGRLIEAYKRVGDMIHNEDVGRGIIGIVDITDLTDDKNDILVNENKQEFLNCKAYLELVQWLAKKSNEYWSENYEIIQLDEKEENVSYKPDYEWVQCNKCSKWRILSKDFDCSSLPAEWFCYMPPFNGSCSDAEQQVSPGVVTVALGRPGDDDSPSRFPLKRLCRGPQGNSC